MDDTSATPSGISLSGKIETSQQRAGEHQLAEGSSGGSSDSVYGEEMSPNGIATSKALSSDTETSQQMLGQLSTPESDKVD